MSKLTNILLLAGAAVGLYYLPTILGLYNLEVSIVQVLPSKIENKIIELVATIKLKNKTGVRLNIQRIGADILFNGQKIAQFEELQPMVVLGNSETNFDIAFSIDAESLGEQLWTELIAQNLQNFVIDVTGQITTNNKTFPFDSVWTIKDFTNGTGY
ncbi:MAG: hypothetical protein RIS29_2509 [Bacteroidota bacterium]